MSVRVARMQNGEDVIADIKEIRPDATGKTAIAYEFIDAFTVTILRQVEDMFQEGDKVDMESLGNIELEFFPWSPLSTGRNIVTLYSVQFQSHIPTSLTDGNRQ